MRYPLRETKDQALVLEDWLVHCRWLYNAALEERIAFYNRYGKGRFLYDQFKALTELRREDREWAELPVGVLRSALKRLDLSFMDFFRRVRSGEKCGFPRFKGKDRYHNIGFMSDRFSVVDSRVRLPKLGWVKFHLYRPIKGVIKNVLLNKEPDGKWYVCFTVDLGEAPSPSPLRSTEHAVGVDVGLKSFATLSTGESIENPRFSRRGAEVLARRQRALALKRRGSKSRQRAKRLVAKAHRHIKNQRADHAWKQAGLIVQKYDLIAYEDLRIKNMIRSKLGKSISDAAWAIFIHCLNCKAEEAGKVAVAVDPRGTSQRCSTCQIAVPKALSDRTHDCPQCGLVLDRDHNAAINIKSAGLQRGKDRTPCDVSLRGGRTNRSQGGLLGSQDESPYYA